MPRPRPPRRRPPPHNPAPLVVGALLCTVAVGLVYWLAVLRPAAREAERQALEETIQRAYEARARCLETARGLRAAGYRF